MNQELEVFEFGTEERKTRAVILDSKLNDALLDTFIISAELVDQKLYKELGYESAKDYFQNKSISIRQAYRFAGIGREIKPLLSSGKTEFTSEIAHVGTRKLEEIVRNASDQLEGLFTDGKIKLGDEEYSTDDLQEISFRELDSRLKTLSKKVEKNDLLEEQNKSLQLEKKVLLKEQEEFKKRDQKYREASVTYDEMERDIVDATEAFAEAQRLINRIETSLVPKQLGPRLKLLIETIQNAGVDIADMHSEVMFKYDEGL
ncbi:MAG TPA: hypothetical protein DCL80_15325 [Balneola sp.]|nr:hypothetical protein [Balneola sp.]MAO78897.1 hypothetical protein [Balneola sp.]MBF63556.1 hypothetical protein [Balneola sp.]HAH52544.1 hypothetical protein [Balneola sp.]HBZ39551.1 hypothetical protein [Balneola sp.]|tara:strand:- start:1384 stop:2163 length:780 start_codon:yes stop_codon:yes gene_type:complete